MIKRNATGGWKYVGTKRSGVSRIILSALLYKVKLPPAETASPEIKEKDQYLKALRFADEGDLSSLTEIWMERLSKALDESG